MWPTTVSIRRGTPLTEEACKVMVYPEIMVDCFHEAGY